MVHACNPSMREWGHTSRKNPEFEASLNYVVRPCLEKNSNENHSLNVFLLCSLYLISLPTLAAPSLDTECCYVAKAVLGITM